MHLSYLNSGSPGAGAFARTKISGDSPLDANDGVNRMDGSVASTDASTLSPRERLKRVPLRNIAIFFITLLIIGFSRSAELAAVWVFGWGSYFFVKLAFAVKQRVDERKPK
jgi:hypothetical protein